MDTRKRKRNSATLTAAEIDRTTKKLKSRYYFHAFNYCPLILINLSHSSPTIKTLSDQPDLR
jgi:hypothetical protein